MPAETRFISVEIVIRTKSDCQEWIAWFEGQDNFVTNNTTESFKSVVYFAPIPSANANMTIRNLCTEISQLPADIRRHRTDADEREFYIGYYVGVTPHCFTEHLETETLELVHEQGASIRIAMYPAPDDDG